MKIDKEFLNRLYRYALSLTKDRDNGYDLVQETVERLLKLEKKSINISYAYSVLKNVYIDQYRRSKKLQLAVVENSNITEQSLALEAMVINSSEVSTLLAILNDSERELLYLWALEGYTAQEIANYLDKPRNTVLSKLHRIKKKIRMNNIDVIGYKEQGA